ncbi:MAG TPA: phosphotransferase [Acidimicrobiales bacterium]|nr:phosphotransferase [Acidimicrobiales bacterium]
MTSTWLPGGGEGDLRAAMASALPGVTIGRLDTRRVQLDGPPEWAAAAAIDEAGQVIKYAWSEQAAAGIAREARLLQMLSGLIPVPEIVAVSDRPVLLVTRLVPGQPLDGRAPELATAEGRERVAVELGTALARLHAPGVLARAGELVDLPPAAAQATTRALRGRLAPWVAGRQWAQILMWCDQVDETLTPRPLPDVLLHGDLHGHNQIWSNGLGQLRAILDWATASRGEPEFDFRYLPDQAPEPDLLSLTAARYRQAGGRPLELRRILAWHILTLLGDALWRSEAGVALPDGRTPIEWVDDLERRLEVTGW